jgi:integrase/recombinase XerD
MLAQAVDDYLAVRRAAGFKLKTAELYLRYFVRFADARGETHVRAKSAIDWAAEAKTEVERHRRYQCLIGFARFIHAEEPRHEIPPAHVFCGYLPRPTPYLFTDDELRRLIGAAARLGPPGSLRPQTYKTLFTLLAVTGLRPAEAYALCRDDIAHDGLTIRKTKFGKSRLVPIHDSTRCALEHYLEQRTRMGWDDAHVFVSLAGHPLSPCLVARLFRQLLQRAGLPDRPGRPRVHDLRHRFATRALQTSCGARDQIGPHMLALTTYLGHAHVASTYWYLESTPQLMTDIAARCEDFVWGEPS